MADFFQNGNISTFQLIHSPNDFNIETELKKISETRNMVLLLPALVSEFDGPAMPVIINELKQIDYLERIVLSLDKADESRFREVKNKFAALPGKVRIVWHDGPRMQSLYKSSGMQGSSSKIRGRADRYG